MTRLRVIAESPAGELFAIECSGDTVDRLRDDVAGTGWKVQGTAQGITLAAWWKLTGPGGPLPCTPEPDPGPDSSGKSRPAGKPS